MFKLIIALDILSLLMEYLIVINFSRPTEISMNNVQNVTEVKTYECLNEKLCRELEQIYVYKLSAKGESLKKK